MQQCQDLIVEIGTEELPPMSINKMSIAFAQRLQEQFKLQGVSFGEVKHFASPRRIALLIKKVASRQPDQIKSKKGPSLAASFDADGRPTAALTGFLNSLQIDFKQATKVLSADQKTGWFEYNHKISGDLAINLIPEMLEKVLGDLPSPKMCWGDSRHSFARPVHWVLALFGEKIVEVTLFGIKSGNLTYGHRFLAPQAIVIKYPAEYEDTLRTAGVVADFTTRKKIILEGIKQLEKKLNANCVVNNELLEQVTNMVEDPVVLCATFSERFLQLPRECLISVMGHHQKSFALLDQNHQLLPRFILISNMAIKDSRHIVQGNEKVMHSRLQDAIFLYQQDLKTPMTEMLEKLKTVVLQEKLGNLYDQSMSIQKIAVTICGLLHGSTEEQHVTRQSSLFCKADLVSKMVLEFPELQGIMGGYYISQQSQELHKDLIATAVQQHYLPKFAEDQLPDTVSGICLSIAFRIHLLCGMFSIGVVSTGDQDPFALRRHALAIIRMLIEKKLSLDLATLIDITLTTCPAYNQNFSSTNVSQKLLQFFMERLKNWYINANVVSVNLVNAVLIKFTGKVYDFDLRINALIKFSKLAEFASLSAANKRVAKLLEKSKYEVAAKCVVNPEIFSVPEETQLFKEIINLQKTIEHLMNEQEYVAVFSKLVSLKPLVDNFFDNVMVLYPDLKVRQNRLALLYQLRELFLQVADIAEL